MATLILRVPVLIHYEARMTFEDFLHTYGPERTTSETEADWKERGRRIWDTLLALHGTRIDVPTVVETEVSDPTLDPLDVYPEAERAFAALVEEAETKS